MAIEIERKFLIKNDSFKKEAIDVVPIQQGYLSTGGNSTVRIRILGDNAVLTIKSKSKKNSISRNEWEYVIPLEEGMEMAKLVVSGLIKKERYIVPVGKHFYEVDVFHDDNEGLVIAEIELSSECELFERPEWLGKEVTRNKRYYNSFIARKPYKKWKKKDLK